MIKNKTFISTSDSENSSFFWAIPQLTQFPAHIQIIQIVIAVYSSITLLEEWEWRIRVRRMEINKGAAVGESTKGETTLVVVGGRMKRKD
jgi:hypothetical protein